MLDQLLTIGGAARILGLSTQRVRQLERSNLLPALRTETGVRLFERKVVERFRQERERNRCEF